MTAAEVLSGVRVAAGVDVLPALSDAFWGQNSGLPGYGKRASGQA